MTKTAEGKAEVEELRPCVRSDDDPAENDARGRLADPPGNRFHRHLLLSGLFGLLAGGLLAAACAWLVTREIVSILLPHRTVVLLFVLPFGGFSLAEIPMMVFAMRRLLAERHNNYAFVLGLNALFVFFAVVYGVPVLLLTGSLGWGLTLCSLGLVRFVASLLFIGAPSSPRSGSHESNTGAAQSAPQAGGKPG